MGNNIIANIAIEKGMGILSRHIWEACVGKFSDNTPRINAYENIMKNIFKELHINLE